MTDDQKLELGIEIVSAMKAGAHGVPIEEGRIMALKETEIDRINNYESLSETTKSFIKGHTERQKQILHKQAMFVADIAIKKIKEFWDNN